MGQASELLGQLCAMPEGERFAPRLLIVAAHPDDDVLGAGARMAAVADRAHVAYVSDGAPKNLQFCREAGFGSREQYAERRREEARRALKVAGVPQTAAHELGAVDQEVALVVPRLVRELVLLLRQLQPELVLTHPYEGGHPDHDATALLVHLACEVLRREDRVCPALGEFASYHELAGSLEFGAFLCEDEAAELRVELSSTELERKLAMLECHETQRGVWRLFPLDVERFRPAPHYDFRRAPAAPFFYDHVDWGVRGQDFLALSRAALAEFGIEGTC